MSDEEEGQPLAPRDALAVGEGFQDLHCPLALVRCGSQADGSELCIAAIVIREHEGKIVLAVPGSAWHRQVARRTLPKGFLTKVCGAEVAACGSALRSEALEGSTVRVWLGLVEPSAEGSIQIPDEMPEHVIGFGELSLGVPALPFVPALAAAAEEHFTFVTGESARGGEQDALGARLARLELFLVLPVRICTPKVCGAGCVTWLLPPRFRLCLPRLPGPPSRAPACLLCEALLLCSVSPVLPPGSRGRFGARLYSASGSLILKCFACRLGLGMPLSALMPPCGGMPGWEDERSPSSQGVWRADLCRFGTVWRKRTRVATNSALCGARLLCSNKGHFRLFGFSCVHQKAWTSVARCPP